MSARRPGRLSRGAGGLLRLFCLSPAIDNCGNVFPIAIDLIMMGNITCGGHGGGGGGGWIKKEVSKCTSINLSLEVNGRLH